MYGEIIFLFDKDFPMEQIDLLMGVSATESMRQFETRINPMTNQHNDGYWTYRTDSCATYSINLLSNVVSKFFLEHSEGIWQVKQIHTPTNIILRFHISIKCQDEYPSILITPDLLQIVTNFDTSIDIVIDNDYHY